MLDSDPKWRLTPTIWLQLLIVKDQSESLRPLAGSVTAWRSRQSTELPALRTAEEKLVRQGQKRGPTNRGQGCTLLLPPPMELPSPNETAMRPWMHPRADRRPDKHTSKNEKMPL